MAVGKLKLGNALAVFSIFPVFTLLTEFIFLKQKIKLHQLVCMVLMLIGATLIVRPTFLFPHQTQSDTRSASDTMQGYKSKPL